MSDSLPPVDLTNVILQTTPPDIIGRTEDGRMTITSTAFEVQADGTVKLRVTKTRTEGEKYTDQDGNEFVLTRTDATFGTGTGASFYRRQVNRQRGEAELRKSFDREAYLANYQVLASESAENQRERLENIMQNMGMQLAREPLPFGAQQDIYPLYQNLFSAGVQNVFRHHTKNSLILQKDETAPVETWTDFLTPDYVRVAYPADYFMVRVKNRQGREEAIKALADIANDLHEKKLLQGAFRRLTTSLLLVPPAQDGGEYAFEELICMFPFVGNRDFAAELVLKAEPRTEVLKRRYPGMVFVEGEYPSKAWGEQ